MGRSAPVSRRRLHFENTDELIEEVGRIEAAAQSGSLRTLGQWTPGQILGHVAAWIEYGYDGYPMKPPPWPIRMVLRWQLKKYLRQGMPSGVRIPGVPEGTYGTEDQPTHEAAERLRRAVNRLRSGEPCPHDSPAFGPMSHDDRILLNLRHAELHLGFLSFEL